MNLTINGKADSLTEGATVIDLLAAKKVDPAVAVVEINTSIVKKKDFKTTTLYENDTVEILRFVGGG